MKNKKKLMASIIFILLFSIASYASSRSVTLDVFYNDIKLVVDGLEAELVDDQGKSVEPFIHNGRTYLPVRKVAEMLGENVEWDGETSTVYIGKKDLEDEEVTFINQHGFQHINYQEEDDNGYWGYGYNTNDRVKSILGNEYENYLILGTVWRMLERNSAEWIYLDFPTNAQYKEFRATLALTDEMKNASGDTITLEIYADDEISDKYILEPGHMPEDISVNIEGAVKVRFKAYFDSEDRRNPDTMYFGLYNPRFVHK